MNAAESYLKSILDAINNDGMHVHTPVLQLGEQRITLNAAPQMITIPAGTKYVRIAAEGGAVRWNSMGWASATSGGYVPQNTFEWIAVNPGFELSIYGAGGTFANLVYSS